MWLNYNLESGETKLSANHQAGQEEPCVHYKFFRLLKPLSTNHSSKEAEKYNYQRN